jgi:hypothetical protein
MGTGVSYNSTSGLITIDAATYPGVYYFSYQVVWEDAGSTGVATSTLNIGTEDYAIHNQTTSGYWYRPGSACVYLSSSTTVYVGLLQTTTSGLAVLAQVNNGVFYGRTYLQITGLSYT